MDEFVPLYSEEEVAERAKEYPIPTEEEYMEEVEGYDWDGIVEEARQQGKDMLRELLKDYPRERARTLRNYAEGELFGAYYLGSVIKLYPSGKYYTPWANSNVEPCQHCVDGKLEYSVPCAICEGQGYRVVTEELRESYPFWNQFQVGHKFDCQMCDATGKVLKTCPWCEGFFSEEAYRDDLFHHALCDAAEKRGGFITNGEGSSTDVFFGILLTEKEIIAVRDELVEEEAEKRDNAPMAGRGRPRGADPLFL